MKSAYSFPVVFGVVASYNECRVFSYITDGGKISVLSERKKSRHEKMNKLFFLRGVFALFSLLFVFLRYFSLSLKYSDLYIKPSGVSKKISSKLNIKQSYVMYSIIGVVSFALCFAFLSLFPAVFVRLLPISSPIVLLGAIMGAFKVILFYLMCLCFKIMWPLRQFFMLNGASNMCDNFMRSGNKNAKISDMSIYSATNLFAMFFFCFILSFFVVSLVCDYFEIWASILVSVVIVVFCFSLGYEIMQFTRSSKNFLAKWFVAFLSFPFVAMPTPAEQELAFCSAKEAILMNETKERESVVVMEKNKVAMSTILTDVKSSLEKVGIDDESEAEWLIATVLNVNRAELKLMPTISEEKADEIKSALVRRMNHEPLSKIFGFTEFYGMRFTVDKNVLSPRMETEEVVERAIKLIQSNDYKSVLDLCTGSGCIAITIKKKTNCEVFASDVSKNALSVAGQNAKDLGADVKFFCSDMLAGVGRRQKFDMIVSNPPYIATGEIAVLNQEVRGFDPSLALDGGEDGLDFYRRIACDSPAHLKSGGCLVLEIGFNQAESVKNLLSSKFAGIKVFKDNFKNDRIVIAYLK